MLVVNPELLLGFCLSGVLDEPLGDVDPGHEGATLRKQPGIVPFPASDIEARETFDFGKHLEEGRGVQAVVVVVVSGTHQLRPHFGVTVPVAAYLLVVHKTILEVR